MRYTALPILGWAGALDEACRGYRGLALMGFGVHVTAAAGGCCSTDYRGESTPLGFATADVLQGGASTFCCAAALGIAVLSPRPDARSMAYSKQEEQVHHAVGDPLRT